MKIRAQDFKPKVKGKSDFFSWNFYTFLKRTHKSRCLVYRGHWNSITGYDKSRPTLYVGQIDGRDFFGKTIISITNGNRQEGCYSHPNFHIEEWEDITEEFYEQYAKIGVCAIHKDRAHKWDYQEERRVCQYCGKTQYKKVVFKPEVIWVD